MFSHFFKAIVIVILLAGPARSQVIPGDSPNRWNGAYAYGVGRSHDPENSWRNQQEEKKYREVVKTIPDKKPSNDPWKNVRKAPTAADRHQPR